MFRSSQETGIHQVTEDAVTLTSIESPQALRLRYRERESRHLHVLRANAFDEAIQRKRCRLRTLVREHAVPQESIETTSARKHHDASLQMTRRSLAVTVPLCATREA